MFVNLAASSGILAVVIGLLCQSAVVIVSVCSVSETTTRTGNRRELKQMKDALPGIVRHFQGSY